MSEIYVYDPKCDDFTSFGLVGALTPTSCVFEEEANGMSEIMLEHPLDNLGRYRALEINNLLQVKVPVRTPPAMDEDSNLKKNIFMYRIRAGSAAARTLYKKSSGTARLAIIPAGESVSVFSVPIAENGRYQVCSAFYGYGWMSRDALESEPYDTRTFKVPTIHDVETVEPAWTVKPQIFRIYEVRKNIASVTVAARHITYDLLYNTTTYRVNNPVSAKAAFRHIFDHADNRNHDFEAFSNIEYQYPGGIDWTRINIINAILDPDKGLCALFKAALVRDNWNMYVLDDPGMDRGVKVEYARNMTGIEYIESTDDIVTRIIPVGETKDGKPLLLTNDEFWGKNYIDSTRIDMYPIIYTMVLECEDCKIGTGGVSSAAVARQRMTDQAQALFDEDIDLPKIEMSVDFVNLGDTEDYKQFRNLERLFLFDYVRVRHAKQGIDVMAKIVSIKWDCLLERMERMEIGSSIKTLANTQTFSPAGQYVSKGLPSTGGTVSGALYLDADPVDPMEAATKQYVDKAVSGNTGGSDGKNGATFIPSVSDDGIISWTNDGGLSNPSPVNIKGTPGVPGYTPQKGIDYFDGAPGVGIVDITIEEVVQ